MPGFIISKIDSKLGSVQLLNLFCGKGGKAKYDDHIIDEGGNLKTD